MKAARAYSGRRIASVTAVTGLALVQFFPLIWLLDFSLCRSSELYVSGFLKWPASPQFVNYVKAWVDGKIPQYFFNSILVTAATIAITIALSLMLGYAFTRMTWKGRGFFFTLIMLGLMIPIHATLLPNYLVFSRLKLSNSYLGLIIPYSAAAMPLGVFIMSGFLGSVPKSLEESAVLDGCGTWRIIFQIIMPVTMPAVVTITVMTFINCWNEFIMAATFISLERLKTLPFSVWNFSGQYRSNYAVQYAVMFLSSIPALIVYAFLSEQITKGVTSGAIKG